MSVATSPPDPVLLRETFGQFPSGVVALAAEVGGAPQVLVASSFQVGVSMQPPLVLFAVQRSSGTWPALREASRLGVSVLGRDHATLCLQLADRDRDRRFAGVAFDVGDSGSVLIEGAAVWMECVLHAELDAGDHLVVLLEVTGVRTHDGRDPLVYHRSGFRRLALEHEGRA